MSNEISWRGLATGSTKYFTIRSAARTMWSTAGTPALEALTVANWANYAIGLTESPASSYFYVGTWPSGLSAVGWYWADIYLQAGGAAVIGDTLLGTIYGYWNGTKFEPAGGDVTQVAGTAQTAGNLVGILGSPVALDSGAATLSSMLTKIADDNGGATFDATQHSLAAIKATVVAGVPSNNIATASTITYGTGIGGDYASTALINSTYWIVAPIAVNGLDCYLDFNIGTARPSSVEVNGHYAGNTRFTNIYAYNYVTAAYDLLTNATTRMNHSATADLNYSVSLLNAHRSDAGAVRIRFVSTSTTTADRLNIDQVLVKSVTAGATTSEIANAVYEKMKTTVYNNRVHIDTANGVEGTTIGVHGLDSNPCKTYADALVIAAALGVKTFYFEPDSEVTLTQSHANWIFLGKGVIALGGQDISDCIFDGSEAVTGTSTGEDADFRNCRIGTCTINSAWFNDCIFTGTFTTITSGDYIFTNCSDGIPGDTNPVFVATASATLAYRGWHGGINFQSLASTNNVALEGMGRVVFEASNAGGAFRLRGFWDIADSVNGGYGSVATLTQTARFNTTTLIASIADAVLDEAKGSHTGLLAGVALEATLASLEGLLVPTVRTIAGTEDVVIVKNGSGTTLATFTKTAPGGLETWTRT